jgi:hypothetical protein
VAGMFLPGVDSVGFWTIWVALGFKWSMMIAGVETRCEVLPRDPTGSQVQPASFN